MGLQIVLHQVCVLINKNNKIVFKNSKNSVKRARILKICVVLLLIWIFVLL